ncbi:MAG: hypothetical protein LQ341_004012 [Variospora aurantia]|nr:MAG: hypothetical protein LQ341_004012 [Variospora aurantia]
MVYKGACYCKAVKYEIDISSPEEARTSLCHCKNCKLRDANPESYNVTAFGLTTKIPVKAFSYTSDSAQPTTHEADNGSGSLLHREFCSKCGSGILEYGAAAASDFRYVMTGTLEDPGALPPKGEFFCAYREEWMPEVPGIFHKQHLKD